MSHIGARIAAQRLDRRMSTSVPTAASTFDRVAGDLAHAPFPALAAAIRACIDRVLKHWRELSLQSMPHLDALTLDEFEDSIGEILSSASDALQSADPQQLRGVVERSPRHGIDRFLQTYSLLELFEEVRILRGVVIEETSREMGRPLHPDEAATFHAIFDIIIQQGVIALTQKQNELLRQTAATTREMNERLLVTAVREQELAERAQQAEAAAARLAAIVTSSDDAIIGMALDGVITSWNKGAERLFGYTAEEAIGQSVAFLIPPDRANEEPQIQERLRRGEWIDHLETVRRCKDGRFVYVSLTISPVRAADGRITGAAKIARDITDSKRAEQQLRRNAETFSTLVKQSPYGIYVVDSDFRIAEVSAGAQAAFRSVRPLIGRDFGEAMRILWPEPFAGEVIAIFRRTLVTGEPYVAPSLTEHRQDIDAVESYEWQTQRVTLPNGQFGVVCYFFDATRLRQAEAALRQSEEQLRQNAVELLVAARHKDEFLATLAHELRNPLAPIRNAVQFLDLAGIGGPEATTAKDVIARQVAVMVRLVDDLLDVSRISRNKLDLRKQRVDLAQIMENAVESSRPLIERCGHELTVDLPPSSTTLDADPVRLAQVFSNLLNNAAKYTRRGGHIWLGARLEGHNVVVSVRDNGVGISAEMLARIFDMFTQVDQSRDQSQGGLGIGLTLARRLVEMHDGSIEVRSAGVDQGSEFTVRLPLSVQPQAEPQRPSIAPRADALSGCRILVVDDNKDSANSLAMVLRRKANEIRTAYDGLEAVQAAEDFRPELVLLDIGLPKLNGYEVARRIREQPWGEHVILVALTGWGQDEDRRRSQDAGFDFHFVKPVELSALENLLAGR